MQRGRQRKYSWEEDSRFQAANDDHDEEWPRAEPPRTARRPAVKKPARRSQRSPFLAALQGASVAIVAVVALGVGAMFALGISPRDLGLGAGPGPAVETASMESAVTAQPQSKSLDAVAPEGRASETQAADPIRQPVAISPSPESDAPDPAAPEMATPLATLSPESAPAATVEKTSEPEVAVAPPTPAPPPAKKKLRLSEAELSILLTRAREAITIGDVSSARLLLGRAARAEHPEATLLLAQTFDPNMLDQWGNRGVRPDVEQARTLYEKAAQLGAREAESLLSALN